MRVRRSKYHVIGERRIPKILSRMIVANMRTIEQKISDAGPGDMRVDPHILTEVRNSMVQRGHLVERFHHGTNWYHLADADPTLLEDRLAILSSLFDRTRDLTMRIGQALEIATFRALSSQKTLQFLGYFRDLEEHDDSTLYKKVEPPSFLSGNSIPGGKELDFIVQYNGVGFAGLELKNVREWFYPARSQVRDLLLKCCSLDVVPVLIARRIHISLFNVLNPCGVITHETYNQRYPYSDRSLAEAVSNKDLLGYHDIRVGNAPDARLTHFITKNLPKLLPSARKRFDVFRDLLADYAHQRIDYPTLFEEVKARRKAKRRASRKSAGRTKSRK
jgi:hypothetical protein